MMMLKLNPWINFVALVICNILVFVPIKFLYPSRNNRLRKFTLAFTYAYGALGIWGLLQYPDVPAWVAPVSFLYVAYYFVMSLFPKLGAPKSVPYDEYSKPIPSRIDLDALVKSESSTLLIARITDKDSQIAGMLTISIYRVPTGIRSIVEDVVVDADYRGRGIAKALLQEAMSVAREAGASGIALTSNPQRVEANQLYLAMGFKRRETNAYYYAL
jgi:GNAT superfamily N-acetyltransferase